MIWSRFNSTCVRGLFGGTTANILQRRLNEPKEDVINST